MAFLGYINGGIKSIIDTFTPFGKRKRRDADAQDYAERPQKRPSAGEALPPVAAAAAGHLYKSQPSMDAFVAVEHRVWADNFPKPVSTPRGGRGVGPGARLPRPSLLAPPADPLPQPRREVEVRAAARPVWPQQPAAPPLEHPIAHLSPEEKSKYDRDSLHVLQKMVQERTNVAAAADDVAPFQPHNEFMRLLKGMQHGREHSLVGARAREEDDFGAGLGPIRTGRTAAEEADLAQQKSLQQRRSTKEALQRASRAVKESEEGAKKNKERVQRELERLEALSLKVAKVPDISDEDRAKYKKLIAAAETAILVSHPRSKIDIKGHDMRTLSPGAWLNDEVINLCISMLQERDLRWREEGGTAPTCHFFNSFFFNKMYKDAKKYNYNEVRRWTLPVRLKNAGQASASILDCDRIVIPANQGNMHWVCAMADLKNKKFVLYDSLGGEDKDCLKNLAQYVKDEFKNKKNEDRDDVLSWPREFPKDIPRQANGYDCGVFTILFAEYCGKGAEMNFSQENIEDFRIRIVRDIMRLKID